MTVKVTREAEPQIELYGAYSGQLDGNGRVSLTFTATDTYLIMVPKNSVSRAQLEAGSFATSYIPTAASTVTRNADVASVGVSQFPYSATEGTIVGVGSSFETAGVYTPMIVALTDGTTNNMMRLLLRSNRQWSGTASNVVEWDIDAGNPAPNVISKVAGTYKANDIAVSVDGGVVGTDASAIIPTVNVLQIGNAALANYTNGHIRQITYIPRRLTNAELQSRTA